MKRRLVFSAVCVCMPIVVGATEPPAETPTPKPEKIEAYQNWKMEDFAIKQPLGGLKGESARGRQVAIDRGKGNCLACHQMPIPEEEFHGEVGPSLEQVAARYSEGELRLRVVNIHEINPASLMPPLYQHPDKLARVIKKFQGRTVLTAQEVEDVVAYLMTIK
jgi:L-cysteine S-thiosulfotransferase